MLCSSRLVRFASWGVCGLALAGCGESPKSTTGSSSVTASVSENVKSLQEQASAAVQKRDWKAALKLLSEAIKLDPNCSAAYFQRASLLADAGQSTLALADFSKAIELSPKDAKLRHTRGFFFMTQKDLDSAIADFTAAIELDPKSSLAFNNRGMAWLAQGDRERAQADFESALKLDPKYVEAWVNRGFLAYQRGDHEQAIADYERALKLNPDNISALNNRGLAYFELKDYERAAADFTQAINRDRYNPKFYMQRRACYLELGREADAQEDAAKVAWLGKLYELNRAVQQAPQAPSRYVELANHLIAGGESKVGLASYETAMRLEPSYGRSYSSRAAFWLAEGEIDKAIADCERALKVEPHFEAYSVLGDAYLQKQDFDRAIENYRKCKRLDAQVAKAYLLRAQRLAEAGHEEQAARDREQAYEIEPGLRPSGHHLK
jgi:tetratricopeptide (TPR) repeat protein